MSVSRFAAACAVALVASGIVQAQSLGEIARTSQEQRAKAKADAQKADTQKGAERQDGQAGTAAAPKTYTNADLKDVAPPAATTSTVPATPAIATEKSADKPVDSPKVVVKGEAYWRARWTPLHAQIGDELNKAVTMAVRIYSLTVELGGIGPLNARRAGVETERQRLITEAQTLDDTIRTDKAALAAIQEEGRRAGAQPGWFR